MIGKIAFLITGLEQGGAETQLVRLAIQLKARGFNPLIISMLKPRRFIDDLCKEGVRLRSLGMTGGPADLRAFFNLAQILRCEKPEVMVSFMYHANVMGALVGRYSKVPLLISSYRNEKFGGVLRECILRMTERLVDVAVSNSRIAGDAIVARRVISRDKLHVIDVSLEFSANPAVSSHGNLNRGELTDEETVYRGADRPHLAGS